MLPIFDAEIAIENSYDLPSIEQAMRAISLTLGPRWPSKICTIRRSILISSRWVANECR